MVKKNLNNPEEKKTQLNNLEEKKSSTQQPGRKIKLNSTTWKKKKLIMDLMLGRDALNIDINAFYILFG